MPRYSSYIICGTPRSGSTLLCRLLASTKVAGKPNSFFRPASVPEWRKRWGLPDRDAMTDIEFTRAYLDAAFREGESGTGVFGLRLMGENREDASRMIDVRYPGLPNTAARFETAFGPTRYIHLSRQDKVAQAVSWVKAEQTGLWHVAADGTELERISPPSETFYDFQQIDRRVTELEQDDSDWNCWFETYGINPLRLTYEALSENPVSILASVLRHLGLDEEIASKAIPEVAKMADAQSVEWITRYNRERANLYPR